ncbi:MAG: pyridoxamine kinase [Agathobacter sp.]
MKKAAVINDLSGFGKCSLTAAIPVLSTLGVQCCPLATAVLTGQTGYSCYHCTDLTDMIKDYIDAWSRNNEHFDAIYSGFLNGPGQASLVMDFLSRFRRKDTLLLVDPVMGDDGKVYSIYSPQLLEGMKRLTVDADLITPNLTEACLLTDTDPDEINACRGEAQLLSFAETIADKLRRRAKREQDVVITGVKCREEDTPVICNVTATGRGITVSRSPFFDRSFSGTGDLMASVLCGCRLNGMHTEAAVELAGRFLSHSIEDTMKENTPSAAGVNFEKHLIELILEGTDYGKDSLCIQ